jgi:hypothetical protein
VHRVGPQRHDLLDGAAVTAWPDLSGHGHGFAKNASWGVPVLVTKALGGLPVVRFDGKSSVLVASVDPAAGIFSAVPTLTIAAAGRCNKLAQMTLIGWGDPADNYPGLRLSAWPAPSLGWDLAAYDGVPATGGSGTYNRVHAAAMTTSPGQLMATVAPIGLALFRDGSAIGVHVKGSFALNPKFVAMWLGGQHNGFNWLDGDLAELVGYLRPLPDQERTALEGYLAHKWGLAGALPPSHPYKASPP